MPSARKSAPPKAQAKAKRTAVPHGPSEGKDKPAASKAPAKATTAPAMKSAARTTRGGAAASKARVAQSVEPPASRAGNVAGSSPVPGSKPKPARVAQQAEQRTRNALAAGSSPAPGTTAHQATPPTRPTAELTPLQERFVFEYLKDFNGARAYRVASPGCSPGTATANASRTLAIANVRAAVEAQREKAAARMELSAERVMLETARLALFDPRSLFDAQGNPLPVTELDDHTAAAVAGLEVLEQYEGSGDERHLIGHLKKYKIADKNSALERAAKFLGMFEKDNRQKADPLLALLDGMRRSAVPVVATPPQDDDAG